MSAEPTLPAENPFLKLGTADSAPEAEAPEAQTAESEGAETVAEEAQSEGLFSDAPPEKRKGGTLAARFHKLTTERKAAMEEAAKLRDDVARLNAALAEAQPFREVVQKRYGKFKDPVAAVDQDAQWMDELEAIKHLPEAQKTIQMIEAKRKGETVVEPTRVRETKEEVAPVAVAETKADKVLRRLAGDLVNTTLSEAGVRGWARELVKEAILTDANVDLSELDADQAVLLARDFFEKRGMTAEDVLEPDASRAARPKPPAGRSTRAAAPASAERSKPEEKPMERAMSTWNPENRAAKRRAVVESLAQEA